MTGGNLSLDRPWSRCGADSNGASVCPVTAYIKPRSLVGRADSRGSGQMAAQWIEGHTVR